MPASMAALGDSITRAYGACEPWRDCPDASWATGTAGGLRSVRERLQARDSKGPVTAHNFAVSGATVQGLEAQARQAVAARVDYVTILIGGNDACAYSEQAMTPVDTFRAAFNRSLDVLAKGTPDAEVLVVSIPDVGRLWEVGHDVPAVRATWAELRICQSMLANFGSTATEDKQRRKRVRQRVIAYNEAMRAECRRHSRCRWDGGAIFEHRFELEGVSPHDYWHPSPAGQRLIAEVAWSAFFAR